MLNQFFERNNGQPESLFSRRLLSIFKGGDGFGQILYFWALLGSLIGAITLIVAGLAYWSWWLLWLGLIAIRCYVYLGEIGNELLDRLLP